MTRSTSQRPTLLWLCLLAYTALFALLQGALFPRLDLPEDAALPLCALLSALPVLLYGLGRRGLPRPAARATPGALVYLFCLDTALNFATTLAVPLLERLLKLAGLTAQGPQAPEGQLTALSVFYICLLGPVVEELIYRGVLLPRLRPFGDGLALVLSALCFGLMHHDLYQGLAAFLGGLVYGYAAMRFSLPAAMGLHVAGNTLSTLLPLLRDTGGSLVLVLLLLGSMLVAAAGGVRHLAARRRGRAPAALFRPAQAGPGTLLADPALWAVLLFDLGYTLQISLTRL